MNGSGGRKQDLADGHHALLRLNSDVCSHLLHALDAALEIIGVGRRRQPLVPVGTG